jgi:hypothetical protein
MRTIQMLKQIFDVLYEAYDWLMKLGSDVV